MKKLSAVLIIQLLCAAPLLAQSTEFSFHFNSGVFSNSGKSAAVTTPVYTNNFVYNRTDTKYAFGNKGALSYGLGFQFRQIYPSNFLYGFQIGFEILRSKAKITQFVTPSATFRASGESILQNNFFNAYPHAGIRFPAHNFDIDLSAGPELAYNTTSKEKNKATVENGSKINSTAGRETTDIDVRLRASLSFYYKSIGLSTGYSYGIINNAVNLPGKKDVYSRLIRFGIILRWE